MTNAPPTLKCIVAWSDRRNLCSTVGDALAQIVGDEVRRLGDDAFVVNTALEPAELRDQLRALLVDDEGLLVIEFERWSSHGTAVDSTWLLRRGH